MVLALSLNQLKLKKFEDSIVERMYQVVSDMVCTYYLDNYELTKLDIWGPILRNVAHAICSARQIITKNFLVN